MVTVLDTEKDVIHTYEVHQDGNLPKDVATELTSILSSSSDMSEIVTYNGAGMGFRLLADGSVNARDAAEMALLHTDMFIDFALDRGFRISLESICAGINHAYTRAESDTFSESKRDELVRRASADEARAVDAVRRYALKWGRLQWKTASGAIRSWALPGDVKFRAVDEAVGTYFDAPPNVAWMQSPPDVLADIRWALDLFP